jgi:hypothetical protein
MRRLAALLFVVSLGLSAAPLLGDVLLIDQGKDPQPIFLPADPSPQEKTAATALANYLEKISGARFPVRPLPTPVPEAGIFVGRVDATDASGLEPDAFRIRAAGGRLAIVGGSAQGTLYGVFALLEQLGCRFWTHDEEDIPSLPTIRVAEMDSVVRPSFAIHDLYNREAQSSQGQFAAKARSTSSEHFTGSHSLYPLLKSYADEHPEIYPLNKDGERKWNNLHFCYLAPGIAEALADALAKQVETHKGDTATTIYFAGMGDWYGGMCECPDCKAVYAEETWTDPDGLKKPGYTATLLRMINKTAEILERRYPGIRVGTMAYMSLEAPPAKTVPRENVIIRIPRLRHCTVHPAETCDKNRSFARNVERWCQLAPGRVTIWEYGANFKNFLNPFPCLFSISDNLRFYHRLGIRGVEIQGNYVSTGGDRAAMKNYVWSKLFWNTQLDPKAVLKEFCTGYYGPAAEDMLAYNDVVEQSVVEPEHKCADEFAGFGYLTADVREKLATLRELALAHTAGKQPFERRVREATIGLETLELWKPAAFQESGGRLARKDLGAGALERAQQVIPYLRGGGANEWVDGASAQAGFLRFQGGPLVTLSRGPLAVKIVPSLNGQIRRITYRDKDLLHVENNPQTRGYPLLGGSIDNVGPRLTSVAETPDDEPSAKDAAKRDRVTLVDEEKKPNLFKTVELGDNDAVTIKYLVPATARRAAPRAGALSTVYEVGARFLKPEAQSKANSKKKAQENVAANTARLTVEFQAADERWTPLDLTEDATEWPLPELRALRITLPGQECVVVDRYVSPQAVGGKVVLNRKGGTLSTVVNTKAAETGDATLSERRLQITPRVPSRD